MCFQTVRWWSRSVKGRFREGGGHEPPRRCSSDEGPSGPEVPRDHGGPARRTPDAAHRHAAPLRARARGAVRRQPDDPAPSTRRAGGRGPDHPHPWKRVFRAAPDGRDGPDPDVLHRRHARARPATQFPAPGVERIEPGTDSGQVLAEAPEEVIQIERLRLADEEPMCIEVAQFPIHLQRLLETGDLERSVHAILRDGGIELTSLIRRVRAVAAGQRESRLLGLPEGSPALEVFDIFQDSSGRTVQWARSRYRADRYEVMTQTSRLPSATAAPRRPQPSHTTLPR